MSQHANTPTPRYGKLFFLGTAMLAIVAILATNTAYGDDNVAVRVEEDWELVLNEPSDAKSCPQFETVMSPQANLEASHARVTWNYREMLWFRGAGLQVQSWHDDNYLWHRSASEDELSDVAETITWTQSMATTNGALHFRIVNGNSTSWGNFGGDNTIILLHGTWQNLNGYDTGISTANCRISYGMNRVSLLRIKQVRRYDADGQLLSVDDEAKVLRQQ